MAVLFVLPAAKQERSRRAMQYVPPIELAPAFPGGIK